MGQQLPDRDGPPVPRGVRQKARDEIVERELPILNEYHNARGKKLLADGRNGKHRLRGDPGRRLERETQRNVELIWLTGRLMPDFKTIADFRKDNGKAIRSV